MTETTELLGLAAKAMCATGDPNFCNYDVIGDSVVCLELGSRRGAITSYWNPLNNDGHALRLAVALRIPMDFAQTSFGGGGPLTKAGRCWDSNSSKWSMFGVHHDDDPYAATRLAIVTAAAEIGRNIA
jgi:hypothetical protein